MSNPTPRPIHLVAVSGSVRKDGYTRQFLDLLIDLLERHPGVTVDCIDPGEFELAFPGEPAARELEKQLVARVAPADGILLSTPEYHGSYSSVLKVLIDNMGYPSVMAGKPVSLLGIATGRLGAIKALEHLRSVCSHIGAIVLPYPVSVAEAHNKIDAAGRCTDPDLAELMQNCASQLVAYTRNHPALR
jgi:FMN reductase